MLNELAQAPPDVSASPLVIYVTVAAAVLAGLLTVSDRMRKLLGPVGRWLDQRQARKLKRAEALVDARIADQSEQIAYLTEQLADLRQQGRAMQINMWRQLQWSTAVFVQAHREGVKIPAPPDLLPVESHLVDHQ